MTRYWIIAPYNSKIPEIFKAAWDYDVKNNTIAIGWNDLGDISKYSKEQIRSKIHEVYSEKGESWIKHNITRLTNALWNFYNNISIGDIIIARRGTKKLISIGKVIGDAYYSIEEGTLRTPNTDDIYCNFIKVEWEPKIIDYENIRFSTFTIYEIDPEKFNELTKKHEKREIKDDAFIDQKEQEFVLEKYLEDFIVNNFNSIFSNSIQLWYDEEGNIGQQYPIIDNEARNIGKIDILARNMEENSYIVIELKKGRSSDKVVGQIMRYMGWVKEHLCDEGDSVKGIIICKDKDKKLEYALKAINNIELKFYQINFKLSNG
ncbi:MAG: PDDEXK nuclease domain-containing protein [Candidatus Lokiarchaeia archaeon]